MARAKMVKVIRNPPSTKEGYYLGAFFKAQKKGGTVMASMPKQEALYWGDVLTIVKDKE